MRNVQAKPTDAFYALQRANRQGAHQMKQLEGLLVQKQEVLDLSVTLMREMLQLLQETALVAFGRGVQSTESELTGQQVLAIMNEVKTLLEAKTGESENAETTGP